MIYAGTKDGTEYGFYLESDGLIDYVELTEEEHMALIDGQSTGKVIKFHQGEKPTLEEPDPPTAEELARNRIWELKNYLSKTDWYVARFADEGKEIPSDIKKKRKEAREEISELREKYPEKNAE